MAIMLWYRIKSYIVRDHERYAYAAEHHLGRTKIGNTKKDARKHKAAIILQTGMMTQEGRLSRRVAVLSGTRCDARDYEAATRIPGLAAVCFWSPDGDRE